MEWILTWLWQGTLVAVTTVVALRTAASVSAATRYVVLWTALAAIVLMAPAAWLAGLSIDSPSPNPGLHAPVLTAPASPLALPAVPSWLGFALCAMWVAYAGIRGHGVVRSVRQMQAIKRRSRPVPDHVERQLRLWPSIRTQGRTTSLGVSDEVAVACLVGIGNPMIVLPPRLLTTFDADDLDRVIVHEYGHVQRRDDWSNLLQVCLEAAFGWHPAFWLLGRSLRLEREVACDDWVLAKRGAPRAYASCLAAVAGTAMRPAGAPLAPGVARSPQELTERVTRLLDGGRNAALRPSLTVLMTASVLLLTVVVGLSQLSPLVTFAEATTSAARAPAGDVTTTAEILSVTPPRPAIPPSRTPDSVDGVAAPPQIAPSQPIDAIGPLMGDLVDMPAVREQVTDHVTPPLLAATTEISSAVALPPGVSSEGTGLLSGVRRDENARDTTWSVLADTGRAIGTGAAQTGLATADALTRVGAGFSRIFGGGR